MPSSSSGQQGQENLREENVLNFCLLAKCLRELCGVGVSRVYLTSSPAWHDPGRAVIALVSDTGAFHHTHLHGICGYCRAALLSQPQHTGKCFERQKG